MTAFSAARYDLGNTTLVRLMAADEVPVVAAMFAAIDPWLSYPTPAEQLAAFFATVEPGAPRFAIQKADRLVGAVAIRSIWFRGPYIQTFALAPGSQGRGTGSAVMAWIEREARAAGDRNLWVAASDFNVRAVAFYERHGYARTATVDGLLRDDRTELLLRKKLF